MKKLLSFGIYVIFFVAPLQTRYFLSIATLRGGFWEYATISVYCVEVLLWVVLIAWLIYLTRNRNIVRRSLLTQMPFVLFTIGVLGYITVSSLWSSEGYVSLLYSIRFIEVVLLA